MYELKVNHA
jgi:sterol 3beta-glucosyltransferase